MNSNFFVSVCALVALGACSSYAGGLNAGAQDAGAGGPQVFEGFDSGAAPLPSCGAGTTQPYVLSGDGVLYTFDPPTATFTRIAPLACWAPGMTPNSMAVDREGIAFIDYETVASDGSVTEGTFFRLNTADGTCEPTHAILPAGWQKVGMAFATASATDTTEALYVAGAAPGASCGMPGGAATAGIGRVDTRTGAITPLGSFSGDLTGYSAELTGTGDGRLYGFFITSPAKVAQLDMANGTASNEVSIDNLVCPEAFAFSFWGGALYLYASTTLTGNSSVTRYDIATGQVDPNYVRDVGFQIVGAGVSTCAPAVAPTR